MMPCQPLSATPHVIQGTGLLVGFLVSADAPVSFGDSERSWAHLPGNMELFCCQVKLPDRIWKYLEGKGTHRDTCANPGFGEDVLML